MATATQRDRPGISIANRGATGPRHLTSDDVCREMAKESFAIVGYVTPAGEPRSSGVVFKSAGRRLYIAVAPDSWKAKHIEASAISFHAKAVVHAAGPMMEAESLPRELASLVPEERRAAARIIEVIPEGEFLTYGLGVSLKAMAQPTLARARVPV